MSRPWIAFFSQTGSELLEVIKRTGNTPDGIVYNGKAEIPLEIARIADDSDTQIMWFPSEPAPAHYEYICCKFDNPLITLHGWLRIVPESICKQYEIYNGHPGLIVEHPELKGKDPQKKAFDLKLKTSGCVIHKVIPEVDSGEIISVSTLDIENLELDDIIHKLHDISIDMWVEFLGKQL